MKLEEDRERETQGKLVGEHFAVKSNILKANIVVSSDFWRAWEGNAQQISGTD